MFPDGLKVFGMESVHLFACGIVSLLSVAFGLDYCLFVGLFCKVLSLLLYVFNDTGVSCK